MGLGISSVQLLLELRQQGLLKNVKKVAEMGSQELHLHRDDLEILIKMANVVNYDKNNFPNLDNYPKGSPCPSKPLYEMLGIDEYFSIDLNKNYGSISHDYNFPLEDTSLYSQFDLVTDYGSCEHAFNIGEAYRTVHRLCKPGGLITIVQALWGGNGYYSMDKHFFEGIAAANNYKILFDSYIITPEKKTRNGSDLQFHIPMNKDLLNTMNLTNDSLISVQVVLQKQTKADFKFPYENMVLPEQERLLGFNHLYYRDNIKSEDEVSGKLLLKMLIQKIKRKAFSIFS